MRALTFPLIAVLALAACNPAAVGRSTTDDPLTPPGTAGGVADGVDPLIVGDRLMANGEPQLALAAYTRAAGRDGLTPDIKMAMAGANIRIGRLHQGERLLREVLEEEPQNAQAMNDLGVALMQKGELGEAHRLFRAAFALQPTPEIQGNLKVSGARLSDRTYDDAQEEAFTLTQGAGGVWDLSASGQP